MRRPRPWKWQDPTPRRVKIAEADYSDALKEPVPERLHQATKRAIAGHWERDECGYWFIPDAPPPMPDDHTPETCEACARAAEWAAETRDERIGTARGCCHLCGANAEQACAAPSARLTFYNVKCPRKR